MRLRIILTAVMAASLSIGQTAEAEKRLQAAIHKEQADGDAKAALAMYRDIISRYKNERAVVARAWYQIGQCQERLGQLEAKSAYERVLKEFSDQQVASRARARLNALGTLKTAEPIMALRQIRVADRETVPWNVSADGRWYGSTDYSTGNAAVVDVATGERRNVSNYGTWNIKNGFVDQGVISRDSKQYAYWHYADGAGEGSLRVVGTDGKGERVLYHTQKPPSDIVWGVPDDWSPDGKFIAIQLEQHLDRSGPVDFHIALAPAAGGEVRRLKTYQTPGRWQYRSKFSPDGRFLAYQFFHGNQGLKTELHVLEVETGADTIVASHVSDDRMLAWTPDGDLLFQSDRSGAQGLWRVRVRDGKQAGEPELVRPNIAVGWALGFDRTGAFHYMMTRNQMNIYQARFDAATGQLEERATRLTDRYPDVSFSPSWSPDGKNLVYMTQASAPLNSVVIRSEETGEDRILRSSLNMNLVGWAAGGDALLARGPTNSGPGLHRVDIRTGEAQLLGRLRTRDVTWSPDGKYFYVSEGPDAAGTLVRVETATGTETILHTAAYDHVRAIRLSPDGKWICFTEATGRGDVPRSYRIIPAKGGPAKTLYTVPPEIRTPFLSDELAWTPDSRFIAVPHRKGGDPRTTPIWLLAIDGSAPRYTGLTLNESPRWMEFHPSGNRLTFSTNSRKSEYWIAENLLKQSR